MPKSLRDHSRDHCTAETLTIEVVQAGSLQRIADAVEIVAKDRVRMESDLKWYKDLNERNNATIARLRKSNAALRGCLRRSKNNAVRP